MDVTVDSAHSSLTSERGKLGKIGTGPAKRQIEIETIVIGCCRLSYESADVITLIDGPTMVFVAQILGRRSYSRMNWLSWSSKERHAS